jgi:hypothetical protein
VLTLDRSGYYSLGQTLPLDFQAYDRSGNQRNAEFLIENTSTVAISALLPANNSEYVSRGNPITVQVVARTTALVGSETAEAYLESAPAAPTTLSVSGTLSNNFFHALTCVA